MNRKVRRKQEDGERKPSPRGEGRVRGKQRFIFQSHQQVSFEKLTQFFEFKESSEARLRQVDALGGLGLL
jgi:hypothetical protein